MEGIGTTSTSTRQHHQRLVLESNEAESSSSSSLFMHESHLELRLLQNTRWAEGRLVKGVEFAKLALEATTTTTTTTTSSSCAPPSSVSLSSREAELVFAKKAESCYKEGLEMIPNHASLCVAYGALCANDGRLELAKSLFLTALSTVSSSSLNNYNACGGGGDGDDDETRTTHVNGDKSTSQHLLDSAGAASDPSKNTKQPQEKMVHQNARRYLANVEQRIETKMNASSLRHNHNKYHHQIQRTNNHHPTNHRNGGSSSTNSSIMPIRSNRAEQALQDAITERDFLMGPTTTTQPPSIQQDGLPSNTVNAGGASAAMADAALTNHELTNSCTTNTHHRGMMEQKTYDLLVEPVTIKHKDKVCHNEDEDEDDDKRRQRRRKRRKSSKRTKRDKSSHEHRRRRRRRSEDKHKRDDNNEDDYSNDGSGNGSDTDDDRSSCDRRRRQRRRKKT